MNTGGDAHQEGDENQTGPPEPGQPGSPIGTAHLIQFLFAIDWLRGSKSKLPSLTYVL